MLKIATLGPQLSPLREEAMHVPGVFERVRLCGLDEVYLVTRVDQEAQVADLLPLIYGYRTVESVPFPTIVQIPGCGPPDLESNCDSVA